MTNAPDLQYFVSAKMDELFIEWLELPSTQKLVRRVINLAHGGTSSARVSSPTLSSVSSRGSNVSVLTLDDEVSKAPLPFFSSLASSHPGSPPHSPRGLTSPTGSGSRSNIPIPRASPEPSTAALASPPRSPAPSVDVSEEGFTLPKPAVAGTPTSKPASAPVVPVSPLITRADVTGIPPFYYPSKMRPDENGLDVEEMEALDRIFSGKSNRVIDSGADLQELVTKVLGLSKYFADPLFKRIQRIARDSTAVRLEDVVNYWKGRLLMSDPVSNFFHIVKQDQNAYLTRSDFREFVWTLLDSHPGLSFLRDSPEFQERYADTVICRIFYHTDRRRTNRISLRDLRRSTNPSIIQSWLELDQTEDINSVRNFFSYEHFYVLYCKFWDLDSDHDFLLDKEDLIKYDGHAWSARAIDRVFQQVGMKFTAGVAGKMGYDDFVWFLLADEDKTNEQSLRFLFSLIDLDGDGVIRDHEIRYFYEDQVHRLECINQDAPKMEDIVCQLNDLISPEREGQFRLSEFVKRRKNNAGVFFSILLSLNKFMQYEQRDPFQLKQEQLNNPELTDWDRFCLAEYVRLAMEAGGGSQQTQEVSQEVGFSETRTGSVKI